MRGRTAICWGLLLAVTVLCGRAAFASTSTSRPLLAPEPYLSIDRDLPAPVKARLEGVVKGLTEQARADRCSSGPPAPRVAPHVLGHQVEVAFDFDRTSRSCPAWELVVVVYSGKKMSTTFKNSVQRYWLGGVAHGRVVLDLPWTGRPPYHVIVRAGTIGDHRGPAVERALRCPAGGCLPGYHPRLHTSPLPTPVLRLRGVTLAQLEASLAYAVAGERQPPLVHATPRSATCASLRTCTVTYVDPAFPQSPYRVGYRIAGQQLRGCWMGMQGSVRDSRPFDDAYTGQFELAACVAWLR